MGNNHVMKKVTVFAFVIFLSSAIFLPSLMAQPKPVILAPKGMNGALIGLHTEYYEDKDGRLTIDDVQGAAISAQFKPGTAPSYGFGITTSVYWVRFTVNNPTSADIDWFLEYGYQSAKQVDIYAPKTEKSGGFTLLPWTSDIPAPKREINSINPIFPLVDKPGTRTYYVRIFSVAGTSVPLMTWSLKQLNESLTQTFGFWYLFYGILLAMLFYNLFIFFSVREKAYLMYVLKLSAFIVMYSTTNGIGQNYFYDGHPFMLDHAFNASLPFTCALISLFSMAYLETYANSPRIHKILIAYAVLNGIVMAVSFALPVVSFIGIVFLFAIFGIILVFVTGIIYTVRGSRPGRFFLIAYLLYMLGSVLAILHASGVLPAKFVYLYGPQIGLLFMMIFFSLGLADKINTMKNELADLNKNLEQKVMDRTAELNAAMEELEAMNQNLKATMEELEATNEQLVTTRDALWGEMQLAKKIQTVLLPHDPKIAGYEIAAYMEPADEVGGDYYDVINVGGKDWIVIGDVSGHGVPAGLVMMMVQTSIQTALDQNPALDPASLLAIINRTITRNINLLGENKYMTLTVFACIDGGNFIFSGLHQDLLIFRKKNDGVEAISTNGMWIGILPDTGDLQKNSEMAMNVGDVMLLFTDGITEARDKADIMYSQEKLMLVLKNSGNEAPEEIKNSILETLTDYDRSDDITMLIVKRVS